MNKNNSKKPLDKEPPIRKLSTTDQKIVKQMLAEGERNREIIKFFRETKDISLADSSITWYRTKYPDEIQSIREQFAAKIRYIPISNKYYRIKTLQRLLDDIMDHLWVQEPVMDMKNRGQYAKDKDGNVIYKKILRGNHSVAVQILKTCKEEMDEMSGRDGLSSDFLMKFLKLRGKSFDEFVLYGKIN